MKFNRDWFQKKWVPYTIAGCASVLLYVFLTHLNVVWGWIGTLLHILKPVFAGLIFAYLTDPIARFYERTIYRRMRMRRLARHLSIATMIVTVLLAIALFVLALGPQLVQSIAALVGNIGIYAGQLQENISALAERAEGSGIDLSVLTNVGDSLLMRLTTGIQSNLGNIINTSYSVGTGFFEVVIGFILAIYFQLDKEKLLESCKRILSKLLSRSRYERFLGFCKRCDRILLRYIACDLLEGLIVGLANFLFMTVMRMPYAGLISLVVGVTNLAPTFGPILGSAVGAVILALINPWYMLWFLLFTVILQTIDGYVIKPKLFGDTLGVSSLWILITIIVGGRMFGVSGILLAIPFAAIVEYVGEEFLQKKKAPVDDEEREEEVTGEEGEEEEEEADEVEAEEIQEEVKEKEVEKEEAE